MLRQWRRSFWSTQAEEQGHADKIAERITQLDGDPDLQSRHAFQTQPQRIRRGHEFGGYDPGRLIAERIAIDSYNEIIRYLGDNDPTSRRVMEEILAKEEEHAEELNTLIQTVSELEKKADIEPGQPLRRVS